MPIRKIDPKTALLIVDFQEGTRRFAGNAGPAAYDAAARLGASFHASGLPVVLIRMLGGPGGRSDVAPDGSNQQFPVDAQAFVPELSHRAADIIVEKASWGAFSGSNLS